MNILQNNMSGRPIMIPVQEGLNVRLVPLKLLPKNILTPPFPLYFLQTFCNPLWYSFKPTRCDNSPPSYPKIGTKHKISTTTSNIAKTTPTIFSRFLISFFLPGSSGFLELCTSKVIISGSRQSTGFQSIPPPLSLWISVTIFRRQSVRRTVFQVLCKLPGRRPHNK